MLITNFNQGELSQNLFGRTDLQQYFMGAATLENVNILPSGGIERRAGTKRLRDMSYKGDSVQRLIPFFMDHDHSFMIRLSSGNMEIYDLNHIEKSCVMFNDIVVNNEYAAQLYNSVEIGEVRCAQYKNSMVFAHKKHVIAELEYRANNLVNPFVLRNFKINIAVSVVPDDPQLANDFASNDEDYQQSGYLTTPGNFPGEAVFFNGRLIFAGTENDPQRLFFSRIGDIRNFSTYKKYVTEIKTYVVVEGTVNYDSRIVDIDVSEGLRFTEALEKYNYDSNVFFTDAAKIVSLAGKLLEMSEKSTMKEPLSKEEQEALDTWKAEADAIERAPELLHVYRGIVRSNPLDPDSPVAYIDTYCKFGVSKYNFYVVGNSKGGTYELSLTKEEYLKFKDDKEALRNWWVGGGETPVGILSKIVIDIDGTGYLEGTGPGNVEQAVDIFYDRLTKYFVYPNDGSELYGETFTGTPDEIYTRISAFFSKGVGAYLPFYSIKYETDDYPTADDGFTFEIDSDVNEKIKWIAQNKNIVVGTENSEFVIPGSVSATNIQAILNSRIGSGDLPPCVLGDAILFFKKGGRGIAEYYIPQADNHFRQNDLTLYNNKILSESGAVDFDYINNPYTKLIITKADGTIAMFLYDRTTGVYAWSRMTFYNENHKALSAATVVNKQGSDDVYLLTKRDGNTFLELFSEDEQAQKVFLDCWRESGEGGVTGHPYRTLIKTMPILSNDRLKVQRISTLGIRFLDSYFPSITSIANGRIVKTDTITNKEQPYSGVHRMPFPGTWDDDCQVLLEYEEPHPMKILAINAGVQ
jgi:hypothetical protein